MSKIIATKYLLTDDWNVESINLDGNYADLYFKFIDDQPNVNYINLQFGFELKLGDNIKQYKTFPPPGVKYISSDQNYIENIRLFLMPHKTYSLYLWANHNKKDFETTFRFTAPK